MKKDPRVSVHIGVRPYRYCWWSVLCRVLSGLLLNTCSSLEVSLDVPLQSLSKSASLVSSGVQVQIVS